MKILVIALAGIGDCLIATPLIRELRLRYPEATIEALVFWPGSRDLLEGNPHLNAIHQKNLMKEGYARSISYLLSLRRRGYDCSLNAHPQGRIHYRVAAWLIGAPLRLSHRYDNHSPLDHLLVNRTIPQDYQAHSIENNQRLAALLPGDARLANPEMEVYLTAGEEEWAEEWLAQNGNPSRRRLGVHVGSGGTKNLTLKRWPLGHYIEFFRELVIRRPDVDVLLFGGPEEEKAHQEIQAAVKSPRLRAVRSQNLRQAAALLRRCHAFLSVDTALMHLAAAMKVPNQVVIEAPTLNPTNRPWHNHHRVVGNPMVNGRNLDYYRYDGGPIRGGKKHLLEVMASVPASEVLKAVMESLS